MRMSSFINPMPEVDDWAVLPDGTIAIVRKDYHVDFVDADGKRTSAPKIPFDWQRLTDSAKIAVIDSAKARDRARCAPVVRARWPRGGGSAMVNVQVGAGGAGLPARGWPAGGGGP